jgi:hypothetical protein
VSAIEVTSDYKFFTQGLKKSLEVDSPEVIAGRTVDRSNGEVVKILLGSDGGLYVMFFIFWQFIIFDFFPLINIAAPPWAMPSGWFVW